jgi:hypothetical protein
VAATTRSAYAYSWKRKQNISECIIIVSQKTPTLNKYLRTLACCLFGYHLCVRINGFKQVGTQIGHVQVCHVCDQIILHPFQKYIAFVASFNVNIVRYCTCQSRKTHYLSF